ncbi:MAG TPA: rod shape-determining protein MreC [Pirellulales bacterium]|nr:rod shape-determining protein MreC [Pirellulales bacterium]
MQVSDPLDQRWLLISPAMLLAATWAAALALAFTPQRITGSLRDAWREALRPSLVALSNTGDWIGNRWAEFRCGDSRLPEAEQKIAALNEQLRTLRTQLLLAHSDRPPGPPSQPHDLGQPPPLLIAQSISARVLGRQAQMFLPPRDLLDVGRTKGATPQALVLDDGAISSASSISSAITSAAPLLDQGHDAAVQRGRLVLAGARVWGKVAEAGPHTSTVQRVTDPGYRDLVQLARQQDGRLHFAARGMLVGRGEALCKIEMVEAADLVTVGDLVFTVDDGVLDAPLLYGRVARVERKPGSTQWEIWMEPAVEAHSPPTQVTVLRMELNPARLAAADNGE